MRVAVVGLLAASAHACTLIAVGKRATEDGSVIVGHTDDAGESTSDIRLVKIPAQDHPRGSKRAVYNMQGGYPRVVTKDRGDAYKPVGDQSVFEPLGHIPQVAHTYAYWDQDYGLMNEHQLAIAESTCGSKMTGWPKDQEGGHSLLMIDELSKIALERCQTARCAVHTMGTLAEEYGFFGDAGTPEAPDVFGAAEALGIADKNGEAWIFHVMTGVDHKGAIWGAQRVPDKHLAVVANGFSIREMDLKDKDNFMASKDIVNVATKLGFYNAATDGAFDFTRAFAPAPPNSHYPLYVGRRIWRVQDLVAPSLKLDANLGWSVEKTYNFSVPVEYAITPQIIMRIYRDHYEGTPFDMTKGLAAGPFGSPVRYDGDNKGVVGDWERQISMFRTTFSFICNPRPFLPDALGMFWFGEGTPHGTVYLPVYANQKGLPPAFSTGKQSEFSTDSAWWAFAFVNNWIQLRFDAMMKDVKTKQNELETKGFALKEKYETAAIKSRKGHGKMDPEAVEDLYAAAYDNAEHVVSVWWSFAFQLVGKYIDGYITTGEKEGQRQQPGYPAWWLSSTNFKHDISPTPHISKQTQLQNNQVSLQEGELAFNITRLLLIGFLALLGVAIFGLAKNQKTVQFQYETI